MTTFVDTNYREHGAGDLVQYIGRDGHTVRDRAGREISEERKQRFIEKSENYGFEREFIISPENGNDLNEREIGREARVTMEDFVQERPTADYVYAVHDDTETRHVHVAMTGNRSDLHMDRDDIENVREKANERMVQRERYRRRQQEKRRQQEREQRLRERQQQQEVERGISR